MTNQKRDKQAKAILESFFYAQIFDRDPDEDYLKQSAGELVEWSDKRVAAVLDQLLASEDMQDEGGCPLHSKKPQVFCPTGVCLARSARNYLRQELRTTISKLKTHEPQSLSK